MHTACMLVSNTVCLNVNTRHFVGPVRACRIYVNHPLHGDKPKFF